MRSAMLTAGPRPLVIPSSRRSTIAAFSRVLLPAKRCCAALSTGVCTALVCAWAVPGEAVEVITFFACVFVRAVCGEDARRSSPRAFSLAF